MNGCCSQEAAKTGRPRDMTIRNVGVRLSKPLYGALQYRAQVERISRAELVRRAVQAYLSAAAAVDRAS